MEIDDRHIINRVLDGDTDCFGILMNKYSQLVFSLVVRIVNRELDAEEITQDVFINAFKNLAKFNFRSNFSTWLFRIAYNGAIDHTRRKKIRETSVDENQLQNLSDSQVESFLESDDPRLAALPKAIEKLSVDERALITFYYYENLSVKEITELMHMSESAVKVRLLRTRKKLYILINNLSKYYE